MAFLALSAALLFPATSAHAGKWHLTCSGSGTATASANGTAKPTHSWTAPAGSDYAITLPSVSNGAAWQTVAAQEPVAAAASITATVTGTWVPDSTLPSDPAPSTATLTETSTATAYQSYTNGGQDAVTTPGPASDGLDTDDLQDPGTGTVHGTEYTEVTATGGVFTVPVHLTASSGTTSGTNGFDGDGDYYTGSANCSASVGAFTVSTLVPEIALSGTSVDPSDGSINILIGQYCGASLAGVPSDCTITYAWSVSGSTFQTWQSQTPAIGSAPANLDASYYVDGPGPLTNPTAGWYWNDLN
jgi:hypothetical protein